MRREGLIYFPKRKIYLYWKRPVFPSSCNLQLSPVFECRVKWNCLAFNLLFILSMWLLLLMSIWYKENFGEYECHAWFENRAYTPGKWVWNEIFRRTSDGLMQKHSKFFVILSTSKHLISVKEVQSCIFQLLLLIPCVLIWILPSMELLNINHTFVWAVVLLCSP